jgi:DNA-directed RNA polymerase subunit RPC12/RpoP
MPPPGSGAGMPPPDPGPTPAVPPPPSAARPAPADPASEETSDAPDDTPTTVTSDLDLGRGDPAKLHSTELTRTYPCDSCGGELEFDIAQQGLGCGHCGNQVPIDDADIPLPQEQDLDAAIAAVRSGAIERTQTSADHHEVVCQNCGGHTTFTGSLTATRCPYCTTPIQRDDIHQAPARLPVDGVVPFRIPPDVAREKIKEWINSRWFAPNAFKHHSRAGSFASVYAAYFTYDARTRSDYRGQRGDNYTVVVGSGENRRTETRIRWRRVSGTVTNDFDDVSVLANEGLHRQHVSALEPWPTATAKGYNPQYVAGHLARTYDHDVEECFVEAKQRIDAAIEQSIRRDIGGDHQRIHNVATRYWGLTYKHLLLPIWLLTVLFAGTAYQVFINGVTGEVQGQRPYSKVKIALAVLAALIVAAVLWVNFGGQSS